MICFSNGKVEASGENGLQCSVLKLWGSATIFAARVAHDGQGTKRVKSTRFFFFSCSLRFQLQFLDWPFLLTAVCVSLWKPVQYWRNWTILHSIYREINESVYGIVYRNIVTIVGVELELNRLLRFSFRHWHCSLKSLSTVTSQNRSRLK